MSHFPDERTLQRCVDGELSDVEHQAFLRELERHPAAWRDVALAYMEEQLWARASRDFIRTPPPPVPISTTPEPSRTSPYRWLHHTALVASTLIAIGLGYLGGSRTLQSPGANGAGSSPSIAANNGGSLAPRGIPVEMASASQESPEAAESQPAYPSWFPPRLSIEERQRLADEGYRIYEDPQFFTVPLEENRQLVVPINRVHLQQPLQ